MDIKERKRMIDVVDDALQEAYPRVLKPMSKQRIKLFRQHIYNAIERNDISFEAALERYIANCLQAVGYNQLAAYIHAVSILEQFE